MVSSHLLEEQNAVKKEIDKRVLKAFLLVFASFILYPFIFAVIPDNSSLGLIALISWPIILIYSFVNVAKKVTHGKHEWLITQADFLERWIREEQGFETSDSFVAIDPTLVVGEKQIIKSISLKKDGINSQLTLFKDEVGDKKKLNFYWYIEADLQQTIDGITYLIAESDFSHQMFNQFETRTTLLEWGQFERLLHVESTDQTEARYLLPPDVMESIYDLWSKHDNFLGRIKFSQNKLMILSGLKRLPNNDERSSLLHDPMPANLLKALELANSLSAAVPIKD